MKTLLLVLVLMPKLLTIQQILKVKKTHQTTVHYGHV
ncbi:unnamed protein product [Trichobilharzia regenti]|nr:unnamed protein product [Trichobilharzia regenti]